MSLKPNAKYQYRMSASVYSTNSTESASKCKLGVEECRYEIILQYLIFIDSRCNIRTPWVSASDEFISFTKFNFEVNTF